MKVVAVLPLFLQGEGSQALLLDQFVAGKPVLGHVLDRLARVDKLEGIMVVTTSGAVDAPVEAFCRASGIACFRGALDGAENVLGLVLAALKSAGAKAGLLVRPDSPLIDPAIVDRVATLVEMTDGMVDFIGTTLARSYPRGMDAEAFTVPALEDADRRCAEPATRRDGTLFLRQNSRLYRLLEVKAEDGLDRPDLEFDVKSEADLAIVGEILSHFGGRTDFSLAEIIAVADGRL